MNKQKKCSNCTHNRVHMLQDIPFARECLLKGYPHPRNKKGECVKYKVVKA